MDQLRDLGQVQARTTDERATEEDAEVLARLHREIEDLSQALTVPGITAAQSCIIKKQLATRRSEKARAERAVRKGRRAQLEVTGGPEAVQAIIDSMPARPPPTAGAGRGPREALCCLADGPPRGQHVRTPPGGASPKKLVPPCLLEGEAWPSTGSPERALAVLLHPETLHAAGCEAVGRLGMLSKVFKSSALDGSDPMFGDSAWRCACQTLAKQCALWCPEPFRSTSGPAEKGYWRKLFFEQLWPARNKWLPKSDEPAARQRRLGELGRREEEEEGRDFKIQVSVRFKPCEGPRGGEDSRLKVPLHQKLMLLRKGGGDANAKICEHEPPEFLDPLLGCLMTDPVKLPGSGTVCDRRTAVTELTRTGGQDPFDGSPLSEDMLEPQPELASRIAQFREERRRKALDGHQEQKLGEEEVQELVRSLGGGLDPAVVEMLLEAEQLKQAGQREMHKARRKRQPEAPASEQDASDEEGEGDGEDAGEAEAEGAAAWWENRPQERGRGAMPAAASRAQVHAGADAREQELGEAPKREGPRLLAVTPPTRVAMYQPGAGIRPFVFQRVLDETASQEMVYASSVRSSVCAALNGYNSCFFVYGQTGSGKTHTMFGQSLACGGYAGCVISHQSGSVLRALKDLLDAGVALREACDVEVTIGAQYVQIYQDQVHCLSSGNNVQLREAVAGAPVVLQGAVDTPLEGLRDASELLAAGEDRKRYAETAMNHRSSRAHTVMVLKITQRRGDLSVASQLHLVDLAGSERVKKSKAQGTRYVEAVGINSSLMVLGKCIAARVKDSSHVPYYESRLTLLLRSALGGNSRTSVVICCHQEDTHGDETLQALSFGERCSMVSTHAHAAMASSASEAIATIDHALAECAKQIEGLEARGKGHLPACERLRTRRATLAQRRHDLVDHTQNAETSGAGEAH